MITYFRNLARAAGLAILVGGGVIAIFFVLLVMHLASRTLHPPRLPPERSPADVGIETYFDITFAASDGVTLSGWYIPSTNGAAIILAHGYGSNRAFLLPEASILAGAGYGVLLFDFRGHGESEAVKVTMGDHERQDLTAALDWLLAQPDVDPDRVGAIGFSMGASTLTLVAEKDERLQAVMLEAPFAILEDVIHDQAGLLGPLTWLPSYWAIQLSGVDFNVVRPVDAICNISPRPVLLIYGDQDTTPPPDSRSKMTAAACAPAEKWIIPGAHHQNYTEVVPEEYATRLLDFFDTGLLHTEP